MPADEIRALADSFGDMAREAVPATADVFIEAGEETAEKWRENVRSWTRGEYSKHYPDAITSEEQRSLTGIVVDVGPESGKKQGGMGTGFEYGSRNDPGGHQDGLHAQQDMEPKLGDRALDRIERLIP